MVRIHAILMRVSVPFRCKVYYSNSRSNPADTFRIGPGRKHEFQFAKTADRNSKSSLEDHRERPQKFYSGVRTRRSPWFLPQRSRHERKPHRPRAESANGDDGPLAEGARLPAGRIVGEHLFRRYRSRLGRVGLREGAEQSESHSDRREVHWPAGFLQVWLEYLTYVLWAISPQGRAVNLGEVINKNGNAQLKASVDMQTFGMIVTAEPYYAVAQPGDEVVLENARARENAQSRREVSTSYNLISKGSYSQSNTPIENAIFGVDRKAPSNFSRRATRCASRATRTPTSTPLSSFKKATDQLQQAETAYQDRKESRIRDRRGAKRHRDRRGIARDRVAEESGRRRAARRGGRAAGSRSTPGESRGRRGGASCGSCASRCGTPGGGSSSLRCGTRQGSG